MQTKLLSLSLALCPLVLSQNLEPAEPQKITKVIHVRGDADTLAHLSGNGSGAFVQGSNQLRAVVIKGKADEVAAVERTIHELDAADDATAGSRNIELVIYLVGGSMEPLPGPSEGGAELLSPVYRQLRAVFPYTHYQLLSTMLMRSGQNSESSTSGMLKPLQNHPDLGSYSSTPGSYSFRYDSATVSSGPNPSIHLAKFRFEAKVPFITGSLGSKNKDGSTQYASTQYQMTSIGIDTNVDLREGQKVVVGTSNVETASATLFLVVTARLVQ